MTKCCDLPVRATVAPFLKWPGGQRWLAPALAPVLATALKGTYFEPFLGAGAIFLALRPEKAFLSDTNKELIEFLRIARRSPEKIVKAVWRLSNSSECYYRVREMQPRSEIG